MSCDITPGPSEQRGRTIKEGRELAGDEGMWGAKEKTLKWSIAAEGNRHSLCSLTKKNR